MEKSWIHGVKPDWPVAGVAFQAEGQPEPDTGTQAQQTCHASPYRSGLAEKPHFMRVREAS
jgi:hypothetical protein